MNKLLESIIIRLLKQFRAKNVKTWSIIVFAVGVLNYVLQQAATSFPMSDALLQIVHYVSLAYITLSNPDLNDNTTGDAGRIVPLKPSKKKVPDTWVKLEKDSDIRLLKNSPLRKSVLVIHLLTKLKDERFNV